MQQKSIKQAIYWYTYSVNRCPTTGFTEEQKKRLQKSVNIKFPTMNERYERGTVTSNSNQQLPTTNKNNKQHYSTIN